MAEDKENGREMIGQFSVSKENARHFRAMALEDRRPFSTLFEILVEAEWDRRQSLKPPTDPAPSKRVKQSTN